MFCIRNRQASEDLLKKISGRWGCRPLWRGGMEGTTCPLWARPRLRSLARWIHSKQNLASRTLGTGWVQQGVIPPSHWHNLSLDREAANGGIKAFACQTAWRVAAPLRRGKSYPPVSYKLP